MPQGYFPAVRKLCTDHGITLILDEIGFSIHFNCLADQRREARTIRSSENGSTLASDLLATPDTAARGTEKTNPGTPTRACLP